MDIYWSHYAKVMEYNRQRILLQNPCINMSCYDVPTRLLGNPFGKSLHLPQQKAPNSSNYMNSPSRRRHNPKSRRNQKQRRRDHNISSMAKLRPEVQEDSDMAMEIDDQDNKLEFVIDDGFMKFLEISMEHKLKRKKQLQAEKQRDRLKQEEETAQGTHLMGVKHKHRRDYKTELYGEEADKIMAMENAIDASLNQLKDLNRPVLWPNIALNLKF